MESVDRFLETTMHTDDLGYVLEASTAAGLPEIAVSAMQGKLLEILVRMQKATRVLEVGTLGGYSAICMARAMPEHGALITLELDPKHANVAVKNLERAKLDKRVTVVVGPALDSLNTFIRNKAEPFDLVFIDADKPNNPGYIEAALQLTRSGSVIVVDNVIRGGKVADAANLEANVVGSRAALTLLGNDKRVAATAIQTVGSKGHDGFAVAYVK
ncbi:MAG: O-methyltransferase [Kofleriaceae bacterium]